MEYILKDLEPKLPLKYFEDISAIPRGSYNEAAAAQFVAARAEALGLYHRVDEKNNVVVKKPASAGCEDLPAVLFQAHLDMVCEKNGDTVHDFTKDGLKLVLNGDILTADGTTLGADDGKGVAYMLALMDSDSDAFPHPPLEFLFTTGEEVGFWGALDFDPFDITARRLIGLDAGPEDALWTTSAGAQEVTVSCPAEFEPAAGKIIRIAVRGLQGGHSAMRITDELGNANKIMGRILHNVEKEVPFRICAITGGLMFNAIPREADAVIAIAPENRAAAEDIIRRVTAEIQHELKASDPGLFVEISAAEAGQMMSAGATKTVTDTIYNMPNGVRMMSKEIEGLPVTSTNMGVVKTHADKVTINTMLRSSSRTCSDDYIDNMVSIAKLCGMTGVEYGSWLPAWPYMGDSRLREMTQRMYAERHDGRRMKELAGHGGLELGVFSEKIPGLDIVTLGCDHGDEHTVTEWMSISSFGRVYDFIRDILVEMTKE